MYSSVKHIFDNDIHIMLFILIQWNLTFPVYCDDNQLFLMTCLWFVDGLSKKRIPTLVLAKYMCVLCMCLFCVSAVHVLCVWYV